MLHEELKRKELEIERLREKIKCHPCSLQHLGNPSDDEFVFDEGRDTSRGEQSRVEIMYPGKINLVRPCDDSIIKIHYTIALKNDPEIIVEDSRERRNNIGSIPFEFVLGRKQVIPGWEYAVRKMTKGDVARVTIPSEKAYGEQGLAPSIPPHSDLICRIELIDFHKANIPLRKLIIDTNRDATE